MARGKKNEKELTIEERLEQALVPVEEQPYEVPENWCWTKLGNITEVIGGGTPSSSIKAYYEGGTIAWITPADLSGYKNIYISSGEKKITKLGLEKSSAKLLPPNTVCLSSRAPIGYVVIAQNELCTNQGFKNFLPSACYIPRYLYWYLKGNKELLQSYASGTTFLELSGSKAAIIPFPLPPLSEQHRIVACIESLFAKLDEAKEKAQAVVDGFETRKEAILHKAFTGELTAKWREKHGVTLESWKCIRIQDVCEKIVCGKTPKDYINPKAEIPYLKVYNIVNNKVDFQSAPQYIPREIHKNKLKASILKPHDVIMNIVGPPLRKIAIIPGDYPEWNMNQAIVRFRPYDILNYRFLYYTLVNPETLDEVISATKGVVGQANISVSQSRNLPIQLPLQDEQKEIVRILDTLLAKEQQAKEAAEAVLDQIETIKKSILARAFRGELGTNDPTEESAVELLKKHILLK